MQRTANRNPIRSGILIVVKGWQAIPKGGPGLELKAPGLIPTEAARKEESPVSPNLFDEETIYCCVKARLDLGEDPGTIFEELRSCPVVDISSLGLVMNRLAPDRFTESPSRRRKTGNVYEYMPRRGKDNQDR